MFDFKKDPWTLLMFPQIIALFLSDLNEIGIHSFGKIPMILSSVILLTNLIGFSNTHTKKAKNKEEFRDYALPVWIAWYLYVAYLFFYLLAILLNWYLVTDVTQAFSFMGLLLLQTIGWIFNLYKTKKRLSS